MTESEITATTEDDLTESEVTPVTDEETEDSECEGVYQAGNANYCKEGDMITTAEDCEAAFWELNLPGYEWNGTWTNADALPGCARGNKYGHFNTDLDAVATTKLHQGSICRCGGSPGAEPTEEDLTPSTEDD